MLNGQPCPQAENPDAALSRIERGIFQELDVRRDGNLICKLYAIENFKAELIFQPGAEHGLIRSAPVGPDPQ